MGKRSELKAYINSRANAEISPPQDKDCRPVDPRELEAEAAAIEEEHVFSVYEKIAPHFSHTRYKMWPEVSAFLNSLPANSLVLDAGCGNGKNLTPAHLSMIGSDRAVAFCQLAAEATRRDCFCSDISRDTGLAFRPSLFDAVISIAVLHHIPSLRGRLAALEQISRSLRPGGRALIYVWAMEQQEGSVGARKFESQDVFVPWHFQTRYSSEEAPVTELEQMQRYYHVFTQAEFRELLSRLSHLLQVKRVYFDSNNWAAELVRTDLAWGAEVPLGGWGWWPVLAVAGAALGLRYLANR
jgi:alkylated DNA repair protein alkB family protein 8